MLGVGGMGPLVCNICHVVVLTYYTYIYIYFFFIYIYMLRRVVMESIYIYIYMYIYIFCMAMIKVQGSCKLLYNPSRRHRTCGERDASSASAN